MEKALNLEGIVLMQLSGAAAGQTVPHVHFHLIQQMCIILDAMLLS